MRVLVFLFLAHMAAAFPIASNGVRPTSSLQMGIFGGPAIPKIPKAGDQQQAIDGIKAAIFSPKNPSFPLLECEFPPLQALNKLGEYVCVKKRFVKFLSRVFCHLTISFSKP
mmetsp:Transcript_27187/g.38251  ORF Transcript_27187/g.38251 Transcript_27187/m.38251 type:complete len:112 (-) Transcript_27187:622-957(-)